MVIVFDFVPGNILNSPVQFSDDAWKQVGKTQMYKVQFGAKFFIVKE